MNRQSHSSILRIPLFYALFSLLWIVLTDYLLYRWIPDLRQITQWQTAKGWLFVAASTLTLYLFLARAHRRQQRAQAARHQSEARFRRLAENASDLIYRYELLPEPRFEYVSPAATNITGYTPQEHYDDPRLGYKLLHPDDRPLLDAITRGELEPGQPVTLRWMRKDGALIWTEQRNVPVYDDAGRLTAIEGIARDVTAQRTAQAALRASEERLRQIMNSVPEGVLLISSEGEVLVANPQAEEYLTLLLDEVQVGDTICRLGNRPLEELLTSPPAGQWHEVRANDRIFELVARPLEAGPIPQGWVLVLRDVTQSRSVERQLRRQERLVALGQLAAGIAHDFNNIIGVILLYTQLTEEAPGLSSDERRRLTTVVEQAERAAKLIEQILDFSRRSTLERRPLDILLLLKEQVKMLQRTLPEHMETELTYKEGEYTVLADLTRMQQIVMNLALNARDAMPRGGQLQFELSGLHVPDAKKAPVSGMAPGEWIRLTVTDTGTGIEPEILDRIFEPFFTTNKAGGGTGLGLAQVHGIVKQHGGYISVTSEVGVGTSFLIYLPALMMDGALSDPAADVTLHRGNGQVLLVVEDELALRRALVETLAACRYQMLEAENGSEALALVAKQGEEIDLILSDVVMPEMGGIALTKALRQQGWQMPVILITGHPQPQSEEESTSSQELAVHARLSKPVNPSQLTRVVKEALEAGSQGLPMSDDKNGIESR